MHKKRVYVFPVFSMMGGTPCTLARRTDGFGGFGVVGFQVVQQLLSPGL